MGLHLRAQLLRALGSGPDAQGLAADMARAVDAGGDTAEARRSALGAMAGALVLHTSRRAFEHLVRGGLGACLRLSRLDTVLTDFIVDLATADPDPEADMLRVSLLQLQCSGIRAAECPSLRPALSAMAATAANGSVVVS